MSEKDKDKVITALTAIKRELVDILVGSDEERHKAFGYCMRGLEAVIEQIGKEGENEESGI